MAASTQTQTEPVLIFDDGSRTLFRIDRVNQYAHNVTLALLDNATGRREAGVNIYGPTSEGGRHLSAKVNWSAMGDVEPEDTKLYATMLQLAAQIADTLKVPGATA